MTIQVIYNIEQTAATPGSWEVDMAKQIESNRGFPISEIYRRMTWAEELDPLPSELNGDERVLVVEVDTSLPSHAVDNMLSDIEEHLPFDASHVETREV